MKPINGFRSWVVPLGLALLSGALTPVLHAQDYDPEQLKRAVARISQMNGDVSIRHGDADVVAAALNAPLVADDRVYGGPGSRIELQFDYSSFLRMAGDSEIRIAQLEAGHYVIQVARGTVQFALLQGTQRPDIEIETPSISVRPMVQGEYRVTVLEDGTTQATVRMGQAEVSTPRGTQRLDPGRTMLARGSQSDPEFQMVSEVRLDEFDQWCQGRDRELEARTAEEYRYVPRDVYGAEDLSGNGQWVYEQPYGYVWAPNVADTWAPYRYGRWSWVDWYGWTWVSYDPWGWAPYHYGRWFHGGHGWCWYPGPMGVRQYWSPALVAFVGFGGSGFGFGVSFGGGWGHVGWIPLAPYEVYHPWWGYGYGHGAHGFNQVNVVNNINIVNNYRNARVTNGITAVDSANFGKVGSANYMRVSGEQIRGASVVRGALPVAPVKDSLRMVDRDPSRTVRTNDTVRSFYSPRSTPNPVSRVSFEQQRQNMQEISRQTFGGSGLPDRGSSSVRGGPTESLPRNGQVGGTARTPSDSSSGWRRFGDPSGFRSATPASRSSVTSEPRTQAAEPRTQTGGWAASEQPRGNTWRSESTGGWGSSNAIRVNPPIVRERSAETPRYTPPQQSSPRYEAPHYQAPQSAPQYQAPRYSSPQSTRSSGFSGNSGGGHSSASSGGSRSGGGGGGSHGGGGGGSRGGGSHR